MDPGDEWTCTLYVASEADTPICGCFSVVFAEASDQVIAV